MTLKEAQVLTLRVLKQVMEEKLDQHNVQLAQVYLSRTSSLLPQRLMVPRLGDKRQRV
jgi:20S proteasome subunit alpha 5